MTTFIKKSDIYSVCSLDYSLLDTVPMFCSELAGLMLDEALKEEGSIDISLQKSLELLKQRHDAFAQQKKWAGYSNINEKNMNLFLARLYLKSGKTEWAQ
jgi:hypothetical protein